MNRTIVLAAFAAVCGTAVPGERAERPLVDCVDPMIGAITLSGYGGHGLGKTFPGAATPFGMVQISPDTITGGDNGPGYSYHHETIEGFSMTHMSGIGWSGDLGNFQVMPADGPARFSHSNEVAKAGYYSVTLDEPKVKVELTAHPWQQGSYVFTYPKSERSVLKIDLARRIGELWRAKKFSHQALSFEGDRAIFGEIACDHRDGGWGSGEGLVDYTLYYYALCSKPLKGGVVTGAPSNTVFRMEFPTQEGEEVRLDVWISYESVQKARALSRMRRRAPADPWAIVFDKIDVTGGTERQRRIFATAVYHACLDPRRIDFPGQSRTVFSGWDVFRTEMPFLTLFFPEVVTDTVNAMMGVMESGRRDTLPVWDLFGCKSGCMIGNPLIPVILTAQEAGLGGIDYAKALDLAVKTTERRGNLACGYTPDSLSETLEYCFDDWCVSEIARRLGRDDVAARFADRARWYTNCWDRTVGWMRARTKDGGWLEPWKGETVHGQGCVESNPLQQGWFVPHDVEGLTRLIGGREKTIAKLEEFFEKAPDDFLWGDYYNHPNEPSHHIVFLFSELGRPDLTQKWTRRILEKAYNDDVRGLCGNDDVGQMSAWYVMAALGLSPMCPGSGRWTLTAPLFPEARIRVFGRDVVIVAKGADDPKKVYVRSVRLDGRELDRPFVTTDELRRASRLEFTLGAGAAEPLAPSEFEPLPAGSIRPEGWLGRNLDLQAEGLIGRLYETSPFLCPSNQWLNHKSGTYCWEEGPYWARTFVKLAALTRNPRLVKEAEKWMRAQADQQLADGWYGRSANERKSRQGPEVFSHIIMNEAILTWYEFTRDERYLELLRRFIDCLDDLPEPALLSYSSANAPKPESTPQDWERALQGEGTTPDLYYWHRIRGGDLFKVLFRVHALTGDEKCLSLADKVFRKTMAGGRFWKHETGYSAMWCNIHTVNFAERFPYGTIYWRRSGNAAHRAMADYWYDLHMQMWGQMPRGAYAAGEQIRAGKTDPNQSFESCSVSELTRSFCLVGGVTGERKWGDRAEDIVFNYAPLSYTPDWKKVHYLMAPNMVNLDVTEKHDYYNGGGCAAYSAHAYRCCLHNGGLALPMFAENLVQRGKGGEMVLFLYAPHSGSAEFGGGKASWTLETRYPFREEAVLSLRAEKPFALRLRVPTWCRAFRVNGTERRDADGWVTCAVPAGESRFAVAMKADCEFRAYPRNGGVSVDRGPLTYSLALGETVRETPKVDFWTRDLPSPDMKTEYLVATPWNYALNVKVPPVYRPRDYHDECFAATNAACEIIVRGKRAPEWKLSCNQPGDVPFLPVEGEGDEVELRFVPMACQRCHVTVFPQLAAPAARGE